MEFPKVAVIVNVVVPDTPVVLTVKVAVVAPAGTVTLSATTALVLLDFSPIVSPPTGAGPLRVKVPVIGAPPITVVGFRVTPETPGGITFRVAL